VTRRIIAIPPRVRDRRDERHFQYLKRAAAVRVAEFAKRSGPPSAAPPPSPRRCARHRLWTAPRLVVECNSTPGGPLLLPPSSTGRLTPSPLLPAGEPAPARGRRPWSLPETVVDPRPHLPRCGSAAARDRGPVAGLPFRAGPQRSLLVPLYPDAQRPQVHGRQGDGEGDEELRAASEVAGNGEDGSRARLPPRPTARLSCGTSPGGTVEPDPVSLIEACRHTPSSSGPSG
jgi:hypothetical protein